MKEVILQTEEITTDVEIVLIDKLIHPINYNVYVV